MGNLTDYIDDSINSKKIEDLIGEIDEGKISIPRFQRQFVWSLEKSAALLDSILKDYPAGALTLWKTKVDLRIARKVGENVEIRQGRGKPYNYVIDGQQRLATLYACMKGAYKVEPDDFVNDGNKAKGKDADFREIYVDLSADLRSESVVITYKEKEDRENEKNKPHRSKGRFLSVVEFCQMGFKDKKALPEVYGDKVNEYQGRLNAYEFPVSQVNEKASIEVVTDIFTRMNTMGRPLDVFEIMVARTYDAKKGFDLFDRYKEFQKKLENLHYGKLPRELVLRVAAMLLKGKYGNEAVFEITKDEFTSNWDLICESIDNSITLFRGKYGVKYSALLPHSVAITTLFSYFYGKKEECGKRNSELSDKQHKDLEELFWRFALSDRYTSSSGSKLEIDKSKMIEILEGKSPQYEKADGWSVHLDTITDNDKGLFRLGSHYVRGILSIMYVGNSPLNFGDGSEVFENMLSLQKAQSSNYHHFFPKSHIEKMKKNKDVKYSENHVLNITLVTQRDNHSYSNKAPREYLKGYKQSALVDRLKTHLIGDGKGDVLSECGIKEDNYDAFIEKRASLLIEKIKRKINFKKGLDIK